MRCIVAASGALVALALSACAGTGAAGHTVAGLEHEDEDYRISVEIPLDAMRVQEGDIVKVDELLDERTSFDPDEFKLDEVVLIARADDDDGHAELLVLEWRSGKVAVPAGSGADDWFEVRIPAPAEDLGGAWLLDVGGAVTVDTLVAVLEPRPRTLAAAKTVYRTTTVYRDRHSHAPRPSALWIYDPGRYYVYHFHGVWPYRYFVGPWSYHYYDLDYRPRWYRHGSYYWPRRSHDRRRWHDNRQRSPRQGRRTGESIETRGETATPRRLDPRFAKLRRAHPRLRRLRRDDPSPRRPGRRHEVQERRNATATAANARRPLRVLSRPTRAGREGESAARGNDGAARDGRSERTRAESGGRVLERRSVERRSPATSPDRARGGRVNARTLPQLQRRAAATPRRTLRDIPPSAPTRSATRPQREAAAVPRPRGIQAQPATPGQRRSTYVRPRTFERAPERRVAPVRSQPAPRSIQRRSEPAARASASRPPSIQRRVQPPARRQAPAQDQRPAKSSANEARRDMRVIERR